MLREITAEDLGLFQAPVLPILSDLKFILCEIMHPFLSRVRVM